MLDFCLCLQLVNPLGKIGIWDLLMGSQPEHENDFSVPRSGLSWMRYSNFLSLILSNMISSSFVSSMMLSFYSKPQGLLASVAMDGGVNGICNGIADDLTFLKEEIEMFNGNSALMYDTLLAFYHKKPFF